MKTVQKLTVFIALIGLTFNACHAQELKRKASLGVMIEAINDSIAKLMNVKPNMGLLVREVLPNATAEKMGLKTGDVILTLNEIPVNTIPALLGNLSDVRANDKIAVRFIRDGKEQTATGLATPKPTEQSAFGKVEYGSINYDGNQLRTILHIPNGIEHPPVVFYIQGYVCQTIDLAFAPDHTIRKLIDNWVEAGFAVYRVEKPGEGDSESDKPCLELNFEEEVQAFKYAYEDLKKDSRIDGENIFLFGHSIGGIIAPVLASEYLPRGVITYGTVMNTWFEYLQELTRVQGVMFNSPDTEIESDIRNATPFWYEMLVLKKSNTEILKNAQIYEQLEEEGTLEAFQNGQHNDRHYNYWSGIQDINLSQEWSSVESNVLALHGEYDVQALNADHIYAIERTVNLTHAGNAEAKVISGADHGFVAFESMEENIKVLSTGAYTSHMRHHYHTGIAESSIDWIKACIEK